MPVRKFCFTEVLLRLFLLNSSQYRFRFKSEAKAKKKEKKQKNKALKEQMYTLLFLVDGIGDGGGGCGIFEAAVFVV